MLTDLQEQIVCVIAELPEAEDFALAGGAALVVRGIVERTTEDLDLFATSAHRIDALAPPLEMTLPRRRIFTYHGRELPGEG